MVDIVCFYPHGVHEYVPPLSFGSFLSGKKVYILLEKFGKDTVFANNLWTIKVFLIQCSEFSDVLRFYAGFITKLRAMYILKRCS